MLNGVSVFEMSEPFLSNFTNINIVLRPNDIGKVFECICAKESFQRHDLYFRLLDITNFSKLHMILKFFFVSLYIKNEVVEFYSKQIGSFDRRKKYFRSN